MCCHWQRLFIWHSFASKPSCQRDRWALGQCIVSPWCTPNPLVHLLSFNSKSKSPLSSTGSGVSLNHYQLQWSVHQYHFVSHHNVLGFCHTRFTLCWTFFALSIYLWNFHFSSGGFCAPSSVSSCSSKLVSRRRPVESGRNCSLQL